MSHVEAVKQSSLAVGETVSLPDPQSMLSTAELNRRPSRPPDYEAESRALVALAREMATSPESILQKLADTALTLCRAQSAGLSILEEADQKQNFHWRAIAGQWSSHVNEGTPRDFGPCGTVLNRNIALICSHPERDFPYFGEVKPLLEDALLIPFYINGEAVGTIWVVSHDAHRFDAEDLRVMTNLGAFTAAAYQTWQPLNSTQRIAAIVDSSDDAIISKDLNDLITTWNKSAERIFGYVPEEVIGKPIAILIPAGRQEEETAITKRIRSGQRVEHYETVRQRKNGSLIDISLTVSPVKNAEGNIIGASKIIRDITEQKQSQAILRALPEAVYTTDAAGRLTYYNDAAAEFWGYRPKLGDAQWCGSWRLLRLDGSHLPHDECPMALAIKENRPIRGVEAIAERPDGTRVPFLPYPTPLHDPSGKVVGAVNMLVDITERKKSEETLRRAEQELRDFVENASVGMHWVGPDGIIQWANRTETEMLGFKHDEYIGHHIAEFHADQPVIEDILRRLTEGEMLRDYEARLRCQDNSIRNVLINSDVLWEGDKFVHTRCFTRDITERKRNEEQIATLAREAEHRTKNVLATVQAAVNLSHSDTADGIKDAIAGRIQALANVHALFVESRWTGAELRSLVTQELSPYRQDGETRVLIDGAKVLLETTTAQTIAVFLHELATNAAKYGALSAPEGHVQVEWSRAADGRLVLRWTETGGPPVKPPTRQGFGTHVMGAMIRGQLKGEVDFGWQTGGLVCEIIMPA
jgi:PAS domain S-box-containing protein